MLVLVPVIHPLACACPRCGGGGGGGGGDVSSVFFNEDAMLRARERRRHNTLQYANHATEYNTVAYIRKDYVCQSVTMIKLELKLYSFSLCFPYAFFFCAFSDIAPEIPYKISK